MAKLGNEYLKLAGGIAPQAIDSDENTAAVQAGTWEATLFVVSVNAIGTSLDITVEDSANGSSWATVAGSAISAEATTNYLILVRHDSVREYVRVHCEGADDPVASVVSIRLNDRMGVGGAVDIIL